MKTLKIVAIISLFLLGTQQVSAITAVKDGKCYSHGQVTFCRVLFRSNTVNHRKTNMPKARPIKTGGGTTSA